MAKWSEDDWDSSSPIGSPSSSLPQAIREVLESVRAECSKSTLESNCTSSKDKPQEFLKQKRDVALTEASDSDVEEELDKPSLVNENEEWRINGKDFPETINTHSHMDGESDKRIEPTRAIQRHTIENQTHMGDSPSMRKDCINLNKMLADFQYKKAAHWIKIASPAKKVGHEMLESTTENHQTKIYPISKFLTSFNSKDGETMKIQGLGYDLKRKVPLECDAETQEDVGDANLRVTKTIGNNSIKKPIEPENHPHESNEIPTRQMSEYVDLTGESESDGLIMQSVHKSVPTSKKRKIDVEDILETEMKEEGTQSQDPGYVDLTDDKEPSTYCLLKLGIKEQDECEKDSLIEGDSSGTDNNFGDGLATPERYDSSNDESNEDEWFTPTKSELEEYKEKEGWARVYVDESKTKTESFIHDEQKSISGNGIHSHIHDGTNKDEFCQESKTSSLAICRRELLSSDFNLIYGSLRAVLMRNVSKKERHLLIQTIISTMGEIEEVTMGEGNPVQQSVRCETPELNTEEEEQEEDDDDEQKEEEEEEKGEYKKNACIERNKDTFTPATYHTPRTTHSTIENTPYHTPWKDGGRIEKLIKYDSDGTLTCVACEKNVDPKENRCRGCQSFKWRVEKFYSVGRPLPICRHRDYSGLPTCRSCRYRKYCSLSMTETDIQVKSVSAKECPVCKESSHFFRGWKCVQCYYFLLRLIRKKHRILPTCEHIGKFVNGCEGCRYYNFGVEWAKHDYERIFPLPLVEKHSNEREMS